MVPRKPDCVVGEAPPELSSDWGDLGDERNPNPPVRREKGDFPEFPDGDTSWDPANGWGIFKLFAQVDMPEAENFGGTPRSELSDEDSPEFDIFISADLRSCVFDESGVSELIFWSPYPLIVFQQLEKIVNLTAALNKEPAKECEENWQPVERHSWNISRSSKAMFVSL